MSSQTRREFLLTAASTIVAPATSAITGGLGIPKFDPAPIFHLKSTLDTFARSRTKPINVLLLGGYITDRSKAVDMHGLEKMPERDKTIVDLRQATVEFISAIKQLLTARRDLVGHPSYEVFLLAYNKYQHSQMLLLVRFAKDHELAGAGLFPDGREAMAIANAERFLTSPSEGSVEHIAASRRTLERLGNHCYGFATDYDDWGDDHLERHFVLGPAWKASVQPTARYLPSTIPDQRRDILAAEVRAAQQTLIEELEANTGGGIVSFWDIIDTFFGIGGDTSSIGSPGKSISLLGSTDEAIIQDAYIELVRHAVKFPITPSGKRVIQSIVRNVFTEELPDVTLPAPYTDKELETFQTSGARELRQQLQPFLMQPDVHIGSTGGTPTSYKAWIVAEYWTLHTNLPRYINAFKGRVTMTTREPLGYGSTLPDAAGSRGALSIIEDPPIELFLLLEQVIREKQKLRVV